MVPPAKVRGAASGWYAHRLAEVTAATLERFGVLRAAPALLPPARSAKEALASAGLSGLVELGLDAEPARDDATVALEVRVTTPSVEARARYQARAREIDRLALEAAGLLLSRIGRAPDPEVRAALAAVETPYLVHKAIGEADLDRARGEARSAVLRYESAARLRRPALEIEALFGARAARAELAASPGDGLARDEELARAAWLRAEAERKEGRVAGAIDSYVTVARHTPGRLRTFSWALPVVVDRAPIATDVGFSVAVPGGRRAEIDLAAGRLRAAADDGVVAFASGSPLSLVKDRLGRRSEGRVVWSLRVPFPPRLDRGRLPVAAGFAGLARERGVLWVDLGLGQLGDEARYPPIAFGGEGALTVSGPPEKLELAYVRAGRSSRAWSVPLEGRPSEALLARGRALVVIGEALSIFDTYNGARRGPAFPVGAGAKILGSHLRYAVVARADGQAAIFDALAGEATAVVRGPGRPVAAYGGSDGVYVAYEAGDVLAFDRDGVLVDRTVVPGRPLGFEPNHVTAAGVVLATDRGLFGLGEVPTAGAGAPREIDAWLAVVELLGAGEARTALALLDELARRGLGRPAELERRRAELLTRAGDGARAKAAMARAERAADPTISLAGR